MCVYRGRVGSSIVPWYLGTRHLEMSAFHLPHNHFHHSSLSNEADEQCRKRWRRRRKGQQTKKRRRHTGSPTPSSLSAPASGARQTADASTRTQPSSLSGARLTQQTLPVHGHATNAGGVPLAEDVSPVPRRDLAASDLPVRGDGAVSRPPPVPLDQQPYHAPNAKAPVNLDSKTPKRRKSNATGRPSSGPVASSGRKSVVTARTRSVGAQIRRIFGLDDQEADHQKEASSSESANDGTSKWGPYAVKNHAVRHPIMGKMAIPAIVSDPGNFLENLTVGAIAPRQALSFESPWASTRTW